jgi:hypothetical protein
VPPAHPKKSLARSIDVAREPLGNPASLGAINF